MITTYTHPHRYDEMSRVGRAAYVRSVTPVSPLTVALFAGPAR